MTHDQDTSVREGVREGRTAADLDAETTAAPAAAATPAAAVPVAGGDGAAAPAFVVPSLDDLEEAMRDVVDPELGINVVDLGLVYDIRVDDEGLATVDMTLTSAACPLTDVIEDQTRSALCGSGAVTGLVRDVSINWVWMPPWGPDKITEDGREQLRALGFTV